MHSFENEIDAEACNVSYLVISDCHISSSLCLVISGSNISTFSYFIIFIISISGIYCLDSLGFTWVQLGSLWILRIKSVELGKSHIQRIPRMSRDPVGSNTARNVD